MYDRLWSVILMVVLSNHVVHGSLVVLDSSWWLFMASGDLWWLCLLVWRLVVVDGCLRWLVVVGSRYQWLCGGYVVVWW